jgi:hypothetical protein
MARHWRATRSRNSRSELIADDGQDALLPSRSFTGARAPTNGRRQLGPRLRRFWFCDHIGPIDSACLEKRNPGVSSILGGCGNRVAGKESAQTLLGRLQSGPRRIRSFGEFPGTGRLLTSRHFRGRVGAVIESPPAWRQNLGLPARSWVPSSDRSFCSTRSA